MSAARSMPIFAITFAAAFAILYVLSVEYNWALFTYHAGTEEFGFFVQKPKDGGPAMYWYGWLATSAIGALLIASVAASIARGATRLRTGCNLSWGIPLVVMVAFVYILRRYFLR